MSKRYLFTSAYIWLCTISKLKFLVKQKIVKGWDDPRLFTINGSLFVWSAFWRCVLGLRRRGYTADAINKLCEIVGVTRNDNTVHFELLEVQQRFGWWMIMFFQHCVRDCLENVARSVRLALPFFIDVFCVSCSRAFVVVDPIKVHLTNVNEVCDDGFWELPFTFGSVSFLRMLVVPER